MNCFAKIFSENNWKDTYLIDIMGRIEIGYEYVKVLLGKKH
jgi:hypothetical protein